MKPCILCQNQQFQTVYRDKQLHIVKCYQCGLVRQADYALTLSQMNEAFADPESYYEKRSYEENWTVRYDDRKLARTADIHAYILNYLNPHASLLDVGSGRGEFSAALQSEGIFVTALEPDPVVAQFARDTFGLNVLTGTYHLSKIPADSLDAITFIQVMEHVENPLETLQCAYTHLKQNGLLVVDVPSFNNPRILIYRLTNQAGFIKNDFIVSHNYYFTRKTLSSLVEKAGFTVLQTLTGRYTVKFGRRYKFLRPFLWTIDQLANWVGIGGITLYAIK